MNKWTWLAMVAFVAVLGGSYYLLSQPKGKSSEAAMKPDGEIDVEDFDTGDEAGGDDKGDNTYDMFEDPDAPQPGTTGKDGAMEAAPGNGDVETIDEEGAPDDGNKDPMVIEDEANKAEAPPAAPAPQTAPEKKAP